MSDCYFLEVSKQDEGLKLLPFLRKNLQRASSVKALKRAIDRKQCFINGKVELISTRILKKGDRIELSLEEMPQEKSLKLFEDEFLCVISKPAGVVSEPKNFKGKLVHRLDKETSGILILAKSEAVRQKMVHLFSKHKVKKQYLAIVDGKVAKKEGRIETFLAKKFHIQGQTIYGSAPSGAKAITLYHVLDETPSASLLLCEPITGRTHQLRVHLKEMGHPILGDHQYGKTFKHKIKFPRHLLHAWKISFPHPEKGEELSVTAPLPQDMVEISDQLSLRIPL